MDLRARRAWIRGRWISLDANELPGRILEAVARNRGRRVALDALFRVAWGRELRNLHDRRAVYAAVGRLREDLADVDPTGSLLVAEAGGYRLGEGWGLAWIHRPPMVPAGGLEARIRALASPGPVAPRNIRRVVGGSPAHLRRILVRMTREGLLRRVGAGRSTAYQAVPG